MTLTLRAAAAPIMLLITASCGSTAFAQKPGGVLRIPVFDNPASMSIHEESAVLAEKSVMAVFNNLVMFDQHVPQNSMQSIVPDLATGWKWNDDGTELTFPLRQGVTWHDAKPFTAKDVACTWDLLTGKSQETLRVNPRKSWYRNLGEVTTKGDYEVTFHLKRPQPAFLALLASGWSPVYPCHIAPREMRQHPIGTGPFKFVEFEPNQLIRIARNPQYWKKDRPYLDAIEYTIIPNTSTRVLGFIAGKYNVITLQPPLLKDVQNHVPSAACELVPDNAGRNLMINRAAPPFDNPDLRRAMALSLDRKAFIDILREGQGDIGGAMLPPPDGVWGMPPDMLNTLRGYDPDVSKNRAEAREIVQRLGYGPDRRLAVTLATRNLPPYRDPAVILIDQLKEIYIDGVLDIVPTVNWYPRLARKDYSAGLSINENSLDEPDQTLYENYVCGAERNYTGYCNPKIDKLIDEQSMESDQEKRRKLVWNIERKLADDGAQPVIFYGRYGTCWQPQVKELTIMINSLFNGWRMEDVWLDEQ
jgi:peptide/nickel transport system substrate-binding protein